MTERRPFIILPEPHIQNQPSKVSPFLAYILTLSLLVAAAYFLGTSNIKQMIQLRNLLGLAFFENKILSNLLF